jgi:hypothetical protein
VVQRRAIQRRLSIAADVCRSPVSCRSLLASSATAAAGQQNADLRQMPEWPAPIVR